MWLVVPRLCWKTKPEDENQRGSGFRREGHNLKLMGERCGIVRLILWLYIRVNLSSNFNSERKVVWKLDTNQLCNHLHSFIAYVLWQSWDTTSISLTAGCDLFMRYVTRTSALEYEDFNSAKSRLLERAEKFGEISYKVYLKMTVSLVHERLESINALLITLI